MLAIKVNVHLLVYDQPECCYSAKHSASRLVEIATSVTHGNRLETEITMSAYIQVGPKSTTYTSPKAYRNLGICTFIKIHLSVVDISAAHILCSP
jgi:hypothetical protein